MQNKTLLIYGAGGLGREIYDLAQRCNDGRWKQILFLDDSCESRHPFYGTEVLSLNEALSDYTLSDLEGIVAVGEPAVREKLYVRLRQLGVAIATLIDKTALISPYAAIGAGSVITEFVTLHSGVKIGENCLVQPYSDLGHDIVLEDHVVLSPFCAPGGKSYFGTRTFVGMQATILDELTVGRDAIISMGSVVFRDVPAGATVMGNPARETRGNAEHRVFSPIPQKMEKITGGGAKPLLLRSRIVENACLPGGTDRIRGLAA